MGIQGRYFLSKEEAHFHAPADWDFDIYSYNPKQFAFSKTDFHLGNHVEVVRYNFLSRIRFRAMMKRPKLQFDFIDSYSTESSRLQTMNGVDSILMISFGGSYWEGVSDIGALGIEVNFDEAITQHILAARGDPAFEHQIQYLKGGQSLVLPINSSIQNMKSLVQRYVDKIEAVRREPNPTELATHLPRTSFESHEFKIDQPLHRDLEPIDDVLAEMARNILEQCCDAAQSDLRVLPNRRREIALGIERILWECPLTRESDHDVTLDELAVRFKVSRRTIQLAVQEHFGIGFIAFRRMIRMHQLRQAFLRRNHSFKITSLANEFFLGHMGRVSRDYAAMFGIKPSLDREFLKNLRSEQV